MSVLISDFVDGKLLSSYVKSLKGMKMSPFQAVHLLHALTTGLEGIHFHRCYHGDLHTDNIMVCRVGLQYELKLLDLFEPGGSRRENVENDICDAIRIFYDVLGGRNTYSKLPPQVKEICCGLKRSLILRRFRSASALRLHIESLDWL